MSISLDDKLTALFSMLLSRIVTPKAGSPLLLSLLVGVCAMPANCKSVERVDPGFSDQFLISLGTKTESFLIQKLHAPGDERFLDGIVGQLCIYGLANGKNPKIATELRAFVESTIARDEVLATGRIYGAAGALVCLGHIGSDDDIDYLIAWALDGSKSRAIRFREERGTRDHLIELFVMRALAGLGNSGHPKARDALLKGRGDPPPVPFVDRYVAMTCQALEYHRNARNVSRKSADSDEKMYLRLRGALPNNRFRLYPGLSESFIIDLGTSAVSFLTSRLNSPSDGSDRDMRHRAGIIGRLVHLTSIPSKEREVVTRAISTFVEANTPQSGNLSSGLSIALAEAMMALGARGTDEEIPFLVEWATGRRTAKYERGLLGLFFVEEAAVHGLGFLGSPNSLAALERLRNDPEFSHAAVLAEAFANHAQVREKGIDALLPE